MRKLLIYLCGFLFIVLVFANVKTNAQSRKAVSGAEVTGTFREAASGSQFRILALGKGKLRVAFSGVYMHLTASGEKMPNLGEAAGEASMAGDTAVFKPQDLQECAITLKFLARGRLKVTQKGTDVECGFGANVSASGTYKKISAKKPKFDAK